MKKTLTRVFMLVFIIGAGVFVLNSASVQGTDKHSNEFSASDAVSKVVSAHPVLSIQEGL